MPLSGGAADKFGNRYEGRWTVYCLLRVLCEEATCISLETVGSLGEGVEFVLTRKDGTLEFHQVKRQNGGQGPWSLSNLDAAGVLFTFRSKFSDSASHCVFVSTSSADTLQELSERARNAGDVHQFVHEFLKAQAPASSFGVLRQKWADCSEEGAYQMLRRLRVETIAEPTLEREVGYRLETLVDGVAEAAADVLAQLALDSVHQTLYAHDIWRRLRERGISRRIWNNDPHVLAAVQAANERYLQPIRSRDILGVPLARDETQAVLSRLIAPRGKRAILLSGEAGAGKTGVGAEVLEHAQALGWPTLALRLDRLEPSATPRQLGRQMELPESPATVLANVAHGRECLLYIDQLDAVSTTSGRNPHFFECVDEIIRQSAIHPNLHLLLSCRRFDLANDERLRRLVGDHGIAEEIQVHALPEGQVRRIVESCGFPAQRLTAKQLALLSVPLHLKIFTEIVSQQREAEKETFEFATLKDLYDRYWEHKYQAARERLGRDPQWGPAFDRFFLRTVREQSLSAPAAVLDDFAPDRAALVSEGVLVQEGKRLSFFHETFFDYAFAQRFVARGERLPEFLRSGEQHLFLRATVRQILSHERDEDFRTYLSDLQELLTADDVRFHLKRLIFQWLRTLPSPTIEEWDILRGLIAPPDPGVLDHAWGVVFAGPWFALLDGAGFIRSELDSGDAPRVDRAVGYLAGVANEAPERVAEIAFGFTDLPAPWPQYALAVLARADGDKSRRFIDLYLRLVERDVLQESDSPMSSRGHTLLLYDLPEKQPLWSLDALEAWLLQRVRVHESEGVINPFEGDRYGDTGEGLQKLTAAVPVAFVERILPIVLELVRRNAERVGPPPWADRIWWFRSYAPHYSFHEQLLEALVSALRWTAANEPAAFDRNVEYLQQYAEFQTVGSVLARAYAANGERYAEDASRFLLGGHAWLGLGWSDSDHWISRQLLEAVTPHCSPETLERIEDVVLKYYPSLERRTPRWLGLGQLTLLNGFNHARRSRNIRQRIGELQRKFGFEDGDPPQGMRGGSVGPPFSARWERMRDRDWLRAIAKYDNEHIRRDLFQDFLKGGASQLGHVLQDRAKQEPARFARLLLRFPENTNPIYFTNVLWGLSEGEKIDPETIWAVLRACHGLPGRPCGDFISNVVRSYAGEDVPVDILELVSWYALNAPDPQWETQHAAPGDGQAPSVRDAEHAGLNSVRGGMARAVADLLFSQPERLEFFRSRLQEMVADGSLAVRTQVAYALLPVLNVDRPFAVDQFLRLCDGQEDCLLGTHSVYEFLRYACYTHLPELTPLLERMLQSADEKAVRTGALVVSLAALSDPAAEELADVCFRGSDTMRKAVAEVLVANIKRAPNRDRCVQLLIALFDDASKEAREGAGRCFQTLEKDELSDFPGLVQAFIGSRAFKDGAFWFFHALEKTTALLPDVVCPACERTVELLRDAPPGERHNSGRFSSRNNSIVLRLYERTGSVDVKRRCLNVIDLTLRHDDYGMDHVLSERES